MHKDSIARFVATAVAVLVALLAAGGSARADEAGHIVFAAGTATVASKPVVTGQAVQEGDEIATGAAGYVYLKTIDNGFLILRPNSRARITTYHVDAANPAGTRIKLELLNGVARHISGDAVKQARQNFRFNTPVAAIGVRGTDFTVFTDQTTSRIAVISGGVIVSGFSGTCGPEGGGPCEGNASRELFAAQSGLLLQVRKGQNVPQILPLNGIAPDLIAPPRSDEPAVKASPGSTNGNAASTSASANSISLDAQKSASLKLVPPPTPAPAVPVTVVVEPAPPVVTPPVQVPMPLPLQPSEPLKQILWGRWQPVLDKAANLDLVKELNAKGEVIAIFDGYALMRSAGKAWDLPTSGSVGFALKQSEAVIFDEAHNRTTAAQLANAKLQIDFGKATFATSFDILNASERFQFGAQGTVARDGTFEARNQFALPNNVNLNGLVTPESGGSAAYIFQGRIDDTRRATGITSWGK